MRFMQDFIRCSAGLEQALVIGIAFEQIAVDAVQALFRYLRPSRVVQKYRRAVKSGKLLTNDVEIK